MPAATMAGARSACRAGAWSPSSSMSPSTAMRRPLRTRLGAGEHGEGGAHRRRAGVVALVDQLERAAGQRDLPALAAALGRAEGGERAGGEPDIDAERGDRRQHAEAVLHPMPPGRAQAVVEAPAEDLGADLAARRPPACSRSGGRRRPDCSPNPRMRRDAVARGHGRPGARTAALSRFSTAVPAASMPSKISALASAMASMESKNSRWAGSMVVMTATSGRTMRDSGPISPAWFMPSSKTPSATSRGRRARLSGTPQWLLRLPSLA